MSFDFEVRRNENLKSVLELRTRFFKWHTDKSDGYPKGINPIALVLNPSQYVNPFDCDERWYAVYYRDYYVIIEQSHTNPIRGPHRAMLYIQIYPRTKVRPARHEWIGTALLECTFASEERVRIALRRAIRTRQYFIGEKLEEYKINMNPPEENNIIATI